MDAHCTYGNDGGSVTDCTIYEYARELLREHDAPTVILVCEVDGKPYLYVSSYIGDDEFRGWLDQLDGRGQAHVGAAFLRRATREVGAVVQERNHQR